jgi:hypothetical protein
LTNDEVATKAVAADGVTGTAPGGTKACGAVWSTLTCGCDGEVPVPGPPMELGVWVPVVVVDAVVAAVCFGVVVLAAAVPVAADAAVSVALVPVTGVPASAVAAPDPVVLVLVVGCVAVPEPAVAEPVPVLEEPLGCVGALPPVLVVVAPPTAEEPPDPVAVVVALPPVLVVLPADAELEPADPVELLEPPAEPVEPVLWLLSALVCAGVPDGAVSA